ncbi:MAG: preprotein translocase subunit YajC [Candidatus Omnitrophica bacterium]|nr:preprotein translocase subunit YajC [Candidatus Omnitrophota bacterium]
MAGLFPIFLIFIIFYVLLIRPQQKQQKQHQAMVSKLQKNDEVVTTGGIHGTIVNLDEQTVTLRVDDNTRIKFQRNVISHTKKKTS